MALLSKLLVFKRESEGFTGVHVLQLAAATASSLLAAGRLLDALFVLVVDADVQRARAAATSEFENWSPAWGGVGEAPAEVEPSRALLVLMEAERVQKLIAKT